MITINEAYSVAMDAVIQLVREGIEVRIKPSKSRDIAHVLEEYGNREDRVAPDRWCHVTFTVDTPEKASSVYNKCSDLRKQGIAFDIGGYSGHRCWELDWSLKCIGTENTNEYTLAYEVEGTLLKMDAKADANFGLSL